MRLREESMVAAILVSTLALSTLAGVRRPASLEMPLAAIAKNIGGWRAAPERPLSARAASQLAASAYISRVYSQPDRSAALFVAYYAQQRPGQGMHSPMYCLPGNGWDIVERGRMEIDTGRGRAAVNRLLVRHSGQRSIVLYWYQNRRRILASEYGARLMLIGDTLLDGDSSGALVRIVLDDRPGSVQWGAAFASGVAAELRRCFGPGQRQ